MAVPTISTVTPSSGPAAGGFLVQVVGTNFKTPTLDFTIPSPDLVPTVAVTIGGLSCPLVKVLSATELYARAPRYAAEPTAATFSALSVAVTNLDSSGVPIPGETATKTSAFTYFRWGMGAPRKDPPMLQVLYAILEHLMSEVSREVSVQAHTDYGLTGEDVTHISSLPSIGIRLSMPPDLEWKQWEMEEEEIDQPDGTVDVYKYRDTRMLVLDLTISGETPQEALLLEQGIRDFVNINPELELAADQDLYPGANDQIPLEISQSPRQASNPTNQNLVVLTMQLRARGIPTLPDLPYENVPKMATFILTLMKLEDGIPSDLVLDVA